MRTFYQIIISLFHLMIALDKRWEDHQRPIVMLHYIIYSNIDQWLIISIFQLVEVMTSYIIHTIARSNNLHGWKQKVIATFQKGVSTILLEWFDCTRSDVQQTMAMSIKCKTTATTIGRNTWNPCCHHKKKQVFQEKPKILRNLLNSQSKGSKLSRTSLVSNN